MRQMLAIAFLLASTTVLPAMGAHALVLSIEPAAQTFAVGDSFDVALTVSGLGAGAMPSLGVYDIDIGFDASVVVLTGVSFGDPVLGNQLSFAFPSIAIDTAVAGGVNLFELSLDSPADLITFQADSFTLATLRFDGLALGTSAIVPSVRVLGDELGLPLAVEEVRGGSVRGESVAPIPEPSAALLFFVGALVVGSGVRRSSPSFAGHH